MRREYKIREGFQKTTIISTKGSVVTRLELDKATQGQLKKLHEANHPAVEKVEDEKPKKSESK